MSLFSGMAKVDNGATKLSTLGSVHRPASGCRVLGVGFGFWVLGFGFWAVGLDFGFRGFGFGGYVISGMAQGLWTIKATHEL